MKNSSRALILFVSLLFCGVSFGQLMIEVPIEKQIAESDAIIEGKVLSKKSYWDNNLNSIYTVNIIEVYKVFKGKTDKRIALITPGGNIGTEIQVVRPSLVLNAEETGVFFLKDKSILLANYDNDLTSFISYSGKQGFYWYDLLKNKAINPFHDFDKIKETFYPQIERRIGQNHRALSDFDIQTFLNLNRTSSTLAISTISPTTANAGTGDVLTITGSNFGAQGQVQFANADAGGQGTQAFRAAYDPQILEWTATRIRVEIPSFAGTGKVRIKKSDNTIMESSQTLTIRYSLINVSFGTPEDEYPTRLADDNNAGGYTFTYNTAGFANNSSAVQAFERAFYNWQCETNVNWNINESTTNNTTIVGGENNIPRDNFNIIILGQMDGSTLGTASSSFSICPTTNNVFVGETDIIFNEDINWNFSTNPASSGQYDFETVVLHELGHAHQLGHVINSQDVMHYSIASGQSNRNLLANDIDGANDIINRSLITPGCNQSPMDLLSCQLSIQDLALEGISIYPNPVSENLIIKNSSSTRLDKAEIYDIQGRFVSSHSLENNSYPNAISVQQLSKGLYFLKLFSDSGNTNIKFVVSN